MKLKFFLTKEKLYKNNLVYVQAHQYHHKEDREGSEDSLTTDQLLK